MSRLSRARDDVEFWKDSHASAVDIINDQRARMKTMAAENTRLHIEIVQRLTGPAERSVQ